ncbi:MAG: transketolase [Pseudomonadota bacterium]
MNERGVNERVERANAIRALSMDAVEQAKCGHPGAPMGLADVAEVLWNDFLRHNPADPGWANRDRFVLSNGHGSMLLYSLLHLSGYDLSIDALRNFRQLHAPTAGHPEYRECPGVETTTGPLGQGFANAVGMALAEQRLAAAFNRDGFPVVDHRTWVIVGDGCLMEGISHEAASLAGTLKLGKLICLYDDNGISIDGEVDAWFTEDVPARFEAYGWRVIRGVDGHDAQAIESAIANAAGESDRPTLVCCKTVIGYGAPTKAGTAGVHGAALGADEIAATRLALNWGHAPFEIPEHLYRAWDARQRGATAQGEWQTLFDRYRSTYPELAAEFERRLAGRLPSGWAEPLRAVGTAAQQSLEPLETRKASNRCLGAIAQTLPELFGGSADLSGSNGTRWSGATDENYLSYGVREFGMSAITSGIALHGGLLPFSGTFLVFMEYARNAVRLAALMGLRNIFVYSHDSVAVGEDGPTHQPVEQLVNLRSTPNLETWRPADTVECAVAWEQAIERQSGPSCLVLTRQKTRMEPRTDAQLATIARGGYVLVEEQGPLELILLASGSEVALAVDAAAQLTGRGVGVRVLSMPCLERFAAQTADYREAVLPSQVRARVAVEAGHSQSWVGLTGLDGVVVGIDRFGLSAPGEQVLAEMGITAEAVVAAAESVLA